MEADNSSEMLVIARRFSS